MSKITSLGSFFSINLVKLVISASLPLIKVRKSSLTFSILPSFSRQTFFNKELTETTVLKAVWPSFFSFHCLIFASVKAFSSPDSMALRLFCQSLAFSSGVWLSIAVFSLFLA